MDYNNINNNLLMGISPFKKTKANKKKPMKVVYISNPMKFKTSASGFRALVQELTGQDSELPLDSNKVLDGLDDNNDSDDGDPTLLIQDASLKEAHADDHDSNNSSNNCALDLPTVDPCSHQFEREVFAGDNNEVSGIYDSFDDVFVPQMLENISGIMPSSTLYYESAHVDVLSSLDAL